MRVMGKTYTPKQCFSSSSLTCDSGSTWWR